MTTRRLTRTTKAATLRLFLELAGLASCGYVIYLAVETLLP